MHRKCRRNGQVMVEFALIGLFFFVVILGLAQAFIWIAEQTRLQMALDYSLDDVMPTVTETLAAANPSRGNVYLFCPSLTQLQQQLTPVTNAADSRALYYMGLTALSRNHSATATITQNTSGGTTTYWLTINGSYTTDTLVRIGPLHDIYLRASAARRLDFGASTCQ